MNTIPNDGLMRYLGLFNAERLLITSPKGLGEVLTTKNYDFQKPSQVQAIGRLLGVGVLLAEGDEHKVQRKNLLPAFAFRHVKNLYPIFWDKSREVVLAMTESIKAESAKVEAGQDEISDIEKTTLLEAKNTSIMEVGGWASRATLDIIGIAGMGRDFGAIRDPNTLICQTYLKVFAPNREAQILALIGLVFPLWITRRLPFKRNGEIEAAAQTIRNICHQLIQNKKTKLARGELKDKDMLSVALESGAFSDSNLVDQVMTFLAAGHETTATAITWAVYMLCLNPDVQSRLRAEVRERLPSPEDPVEVGSDIIDTMPYLNAVVNEILRYYPPVPLTLREAAVPTSILGQHIPKGTRILLIPWATNYDKAYWGDDADKFLPERWLPGVEGRESREKWVGNGGAESNYNHMTFLHGPRACIGQGFAKAEFACLLAAWVGRFEFELRDKELMDESKVDIKGGVTAKPTKGMWVKAKIVDGW